MRVVSKTRLKEFWDQYPDAEIGLLHWFKKITNKDKHFQKPSDIIAEFPKSDFVGNGRVVFNIAHNKYRLIVLFIFQTQICYVRFVGTHSEYDRIKDIQNV
ncbi:type II toxin-antitoxin system HigB family toxin [Runella limosa]|uniref:type II toxin-antitoxin system HigB family toxin n=1 Tax=Runella limosa TaxID=370978 RepID=UPI00041B1A15|nr:type II toxin-antitoxin system HigB family toxin [Runella limosa]